MTPGEAAYIEFWKGRPRNKWESITDAHREKWEDIAKAVIAVKLADAVPKVQEAAWGDGHHWSERYVRELLE